MIKTKIYFETHILKEKVIELEDRSPRNNIGIGVHVELKRYGRKDKNNNTGHTKNHKKHS